MTAAIPFPVLSGAASLDERVRGTVDAHYGALWRFLRRMGVAEANVEDAAQQVLVVFARRADRVPPDAERAFLFATALRVASDHRRRDARACEVPCPGESLHAVVDPRPDAEGQMGQGELRRCLDDVLDALHPDLRAVFVLAELEEMTMAAIASVLGIPPGTVASRLRRGREVFAARAAEVRARLEGERMR